MPTPLDVTEYLGYLIQRWRFAAIVCAVAGALSLGVSLLQPKQYTSTASVLIDAPAGSDPRTSTAFSPVYLESLKTYEHFVQSDTLFLEAIEKLHLRATYPGASAESLKRRLLKVDMPRDTRILQVSATLRDPAKAQELAQYIAEQTVNLNRTLSQQSEQDQINQAQQQLNVAREAVQGAENALSEQSVREPYDALQAEVDNLVELRARVERDLLAARVDIADYTAQGNQRELGSVRVREAALAKQVSEVDAELNAKEKSASARRSRLQGLGEDVQAARRNFDQAQTRLNEIRVTAGTHSERLRVIDPGLVPQRPSAPNIPLNVIAALVVAVVFAWLYLTVVFALRQEHRRAAVRAYSSER